MVLGRQQKAVVKAMEEVLTNTVMERVGNRITEESKAQQKDINKELIKRLDDWDNDVKNRIKELSDKELVPLIQKIVKVEVSKNK